MDHSPVPTARLKCVVEQCPSPVSWVSRVVADGSTDCCTRHTAENEAARLAEYVQLELGRVEGDLTECIEAARELVEKLVLVAACREAARAAAHS